MENSERAKYFSDNKIIGIDPGMSGGIAVFSIEKNSIIEVISMPETPMDIINFLKMYSKNSVCYLEKVQGLPGMSGGGMFTFGKNFGHLQMSLLALKIPTYDVLPQTWQKVYQLGTKGKDKSSVWKNKLKAKAQQIYPSIKITLAIADAVLIMEYGRMKEKN